MALRGHLADSTQRKHQATYEILARQFCERTAPDRTLSTPMHELPLIAIEPTPHDVQYLEDRIYEYNSKATGIADGELLGFLVREGDRIVGGICGNTWGATCELRQFWVEESHRHRGLGTKLFEAAEQEARRRGCSQLILMTFSFQAPAFYEKNGFEVVATIADHPRGHRNFLMRKYLGVDSRTSLSR
jgi:GNAT superfamily N-acetyltransferase